MPMAVLPTNWLGLLKTTLEEFLLRLALRYSALMQEEQDTFVKVIMWSSLAGIGGAVKYVSTVIRSTEAVSNRRFFLLLAANMFISSFCGLMGMLLAMNMTDSWALHGLTAGGIGYMGTTGLDLVILNMKNKIQPNSPVSAVFPVPPQSDPAAR